MEVVVLHRFLEYFCPKQGQDFKPQAGAMYPNMDKVPSGLPHLRSMSVAEVLSSQPVSDHKIKMHPESIYHLPSSYLELVKIYSKASRDYRKRTINNLNSSDHCTNRKKHIPQQTDIIFRKPVFQTASMQGIFFDTLFLKSIKGNATLYKLTLCAKISEALQFSSFFFPVFIFFCSFLHFFFPIGIVNKLDMLTGSRC